MRNLLNIIVILVTLTGFGLAKLHFENQLNKEMVQENLLQKPLDHGERLKLGQTGAAVALGGLRSLVAAVWNFRAFLQFSDLDWIKLEQSYHIITTLQPQTTSYWQTGAWHLHTNASVYYKENTKLSPFRRRELQKLYIKKGSDLLEEGVRQNPDNWKLYNSLARLWSDHYKFPDYERSVKYYDATLACKSLPSYIRPMLERFRFYTLTRIPKRRKEALKEGVRLFKASPNNHLPSLCNYIFALQNELNIPKSERIPDSELFPDPKTQLYWLSNLWRHRNQDYPMSGVIAKIEELKKQLNTPSHNHPPQKTRQPGPFERSIKP